MTPKQQAEGALNVFAKQALHPETDEHLFHEIEDSVDDLRTYITQLEQRVTTLEQEMELDEQEAMDNEAEITRLEQRVVEKTALETLGAMAIAKHNWSEASDMCPQDYDTSVAAGEAQRAFDAALKAALAQQKGE